MTELDFSSIVDCRRCSTLFDFSGYRRCFICRINRIPEGCLLRKYSIFSNYSDFRRSPKMIVLFVELVGFPNTDLLNDVRFDVAFPKLFWASFDSARVGFPEIGCSTMFDFPRGLITEGRTEDALFVELGGFSQINYFDTAQFAEFVGWPKMFDNVPFFS